MKILKLLISNKTKLGASGQLLVELLVVMGLMTVILPALMGGVITSQQSLPQREQRNKAALLMQETIDQLRIIREANWEGIAVAGTYHPESMDTKWQLVTGSDTTDGLSRQIIIRDVQRDSTGVIVDSGGTSDPSTKQIDIIIDWTLPSPGQIASSFYLTRYLDNLTFIETSKADFDLGELAGTTTTDSGGDGQVLLGSGGVGNWCEPFESMINEVDLPKNGVAKTISAIEGSIYVGTGENASGVSLANVAITQEDPPQMSIVGTLDGYKTNSIFGEEDYVYIGTDTNNSEIVIVDVRTLPYRQVGFFNIPVAADAEGVGVAQSIGYVIESNKLWSFDLSSKNGERPIKDPDGVSLAGTATSIELVGSYAYVSLTNSPIKMQVVDVSNPENMQVVAQASPNAQSATDIVVNATETRAYLVTEHSDTQNELHIIDITSKSGNLPTLGSYNTNGMTPTGVALVPGNIVIVVGNNAEEYQVVGISTESNPVQCGGLDLDLNINGIATVLELDGDAFSYLLTTSASTELKVIRGGPGGEYTNEGTFESQIFDAGYMTAFNYIESVLTVPGQTTSYFQVAATDPVNDDCEQANFVYLGPDGTTETSFDSAGPIYLNDDGVGYENPARCFRYKVFMSTNEQSQTPVLESMIINYSP